MPIHGIENLRNPKAPIQELLSGHGAYHMDLFELIGESDSLDRAISFNSKAVALTPDGDPDKCVHYFKLGDAHLRRFEHVGSIEDLEMAISTLENALTLMHEGDPNNASCYNSLGSALSKRFQHIGSVADLERAILVLESAVRLTPQGHPDASLRYNSLGGSLRKRYQRLGSIDDLERSISTLEYAMEHVAEGSADKLSYCSNLGSALSARFQRLGHVEDLERAISMLTIATKLVPESQPDKPLHYNNLGNALLRRFERLGGVGDLEEATSSLRNAVTLMPEEHPNKHVCCNSLGNAAIIRFERFKDLADLEEAILNLERAMSLTPNGHPTKASRYNNLGNALLSRFERIGCVADLERGISHLEKAEQLTPEGHPDKPLRYNNLGSALFRRFERLHNISDIDRSISNHKRAVKLTPDEHPSKLDRCINLGGAHWIRFQHISAIEDLGHAHDTYCMAALSPVGSPKLQFIAALDWARCAKLSHRYPLPAFKRAIDLLPRIAWLALSIPDQHSLLTDIGGSVRDAVATAIQFEQDETAVEWAEQGRSIVWQNLLNLRTPVDELRTVCPSLANQLQKLSLQMEAPAAYDFGLDNYQGGRLENITHSHVQMAIQWDNTIEEIRKIPRFEEFLKPKQFATLSPCAHEGPVVILNIQESRCDALVLISDDLKHVSARSVPLERFSYEKGQRLVKNLKGLLSSSSLRSPQARKHVWVGDAVDNEAMFKKILGVLWSDVVNPVIQSLAYQPRRDDLPHIWWCATGPLAFLPIHAAGLYDTDDIGGKVSDYVLSSYTPTLTAILDKHQPTTQGDFKLLAVAQPSAPGAPPIPMTENEIGRIRGLISGLTIVTLVKEEATMERVLQGMKESNWVHLACHGYQNMKNPMKSGLLLHDGTLDLSTIVKESLPKADFAFLSACQTAAGDENLAEESVHLAAGMLLSGYRGVVATMWSIRDDDAPQIAEDVYSRILNSELPNREEAAYALHVAVKRLRTESKASFLSWVPFIHMGR